MTDSDFQNFLSTIKIGKKTALQVLMELFLQGEDVEAQPTLEQPLDKPVVLAVELAITMVVEVVEPQP
jgi:hypothetical protein